MAKPRVTTFFDKKQMSRDELLVESYMRSIDMPEWYRGLSQFQLKAAFSLITSIRDDLEQNTSYRVRNILNTIGLRPTLTKANVRFVMKLSRGNDLAFLWFIKEIFYKSEGPGYNLNEQLILTCIANLDLLFTIRGLDSILPPEQKAKKSSNIPKNPFHYIDKQLKPLAKQQSQQLQKQEKQQKKQWQQQQRRNQLRRNSLARASQQQQRPRRSLSTIKKIYKLPYLNIIKKPNPYGKSLSAQPPDYVLHLKFLDAYKDPNYVIPNAHNRWFADYQISIGRMTAATIVNQNLDSIFMPNIVHANFEARSNPNIPNMASTFFDANVFKELKLPSKIELRSQEKQLCMHHQVLEDLERNLEQELLVIAREKCLKYFDAETAKKEERLARLRKQIESDVNMHMKRFKELTKKSQSQLLLMSKNSLETCSMCSLNSELRSKRSNLCCDKENKANPKYHYVITGCGLEKQEVKPSNEQRIPLRERAGYNENNMGNCGPNRKFPSETEIIGDCLKNNKQWKSSKEQIFLIPSKENLPKSRHQRQNYHHASCSCASSHNSQSSYSFEDVSSNEYMRNYNYDHPDDLGSECSCCAYFKAPKKHQPFKFDYRKIFNVKTPFDGENLKKICATAIDRDDDDREEDNERERRRYNRKRCPSRESVNTAINEYAAKTFKEKLHKYNKMNDEYLAEMEMREAVNSKKQKYYDPNDEKLMHRMLEEGLKTLAKDARYVLPTLPDAHKIPILRYWIYQRYGKVYSAKELVQIFKKSLELFRALNKKHIHERLPTSYLIGRAVYTDYSCRSYLLRKSNRVRNLFYKSIDTSIMEQARRLFMAMSPYLCTGRPQNKTIFSYLPARPNDIHHFHVWSYKTNKRKWKKVLSTSLI